MRSVFNYTKAVNKPTEIWFYESLEQPADIHLPGDDAHEMAVTDGWGRAKEFSTDKEGFSVHDFKTGFEAWEDDESTRKQVLSRGRGVFEEDGGGEGGVGV